MVEVPRRCWKLWHLTVAVLVSALLLRAIRTLGDEPNQGLREMAIASIAVFAFVGSIPLGERLGDRTTRGLMDWGLQRGGVIGFCAWAFGIGANVAFILGTMVVMPVVVIAGYFWLAHSVGF